MGGKLKKILMFLTWDGVQIYFPLEKMILIFFIVSGLYFLEQF